MRHKKRVAPVSFLICGAQKSGTTALTEYLRQAEDVYIPEAKELHYFDDEDKGWEGLFENTISRWMYNNKFEGAGRGKICGEATPVYMYWEPCASRIWKYNPEMRVIIILRNPIDRAYSHWWMETKRGAEELSFEDALDVEEERSRMKLPLQDRVHSYVDRGFYTNQIRRYWRFFGQERVLVLRHEDLLNSPQSVIDRVCTHIGSRGFRIKGNVESFKGQYLGVMSKERRQLLCNVYEYEIRSLERMLGWDCEDWLCD